MLSKSLKDYQIVLSSDVHEKDGIGIEVWFEEEILIEIFRDDKKENYTITLFVKSLPLELIEESIQYFKKEIPREFQK
ncbi:MAG: hypothetical protein ABJR05_00765 [Balneola sp.]